MGTRTRACPRPEEAGELGRRRSAPGHARNCSVWSTVSAWAGALRAAGGREPSDRGFLTRSDGGPRRAEGWQTLRTARAISARAWCAASFGPEGEFPPADPARPKPHPGPPRSADRPRRPHDAGRRTLPARPPRTARQVASWTAFPPLHREGGPGSARVGWGSLTQPSKPHPTPCTDPPPDPLRGPPSPQGGGKAVFAGPAPDVIRRQR